MCAVTFLNRRNIVREYDGILFDKESLSSLCDATVTFETDETFSVKSMASSSTRVNRQRSEESTQNVVVAIQRRGIGRGYGFGRREESKNSSIVDDLQNFLSKM